MSDYKFSRPRRYGVRAGLPKGVAEDPAKCIQAVWVGWNGMVESQCARKRGHGPGGLYCSQHAKKAKAGSP